MSSRHLHVTSFISDENGLLAFLEAARALFGFAEPVTRPDGRTVAVVLYSADLGDIGNELFLLPDAAGKLAGILEDDVTIVSAWDGHDHENCERVWHVTGRRNGGKPPPSVPFWAGMA